MKSGFKIWLFRVLGVVAVFLLVLSFILPWWSMDILVLGLKDALIMHPYGLEHKLAENAVFIEPYLPPVWLTYIAYAFLAGASAALLVSLFLKNKYGRLLMGVVGLGFVLYILVATGYLFITLNKFGMSISGYSFVDQTQGFPYHTGLITGFLPGYLVAWFTAIYTSVLAFFWNKYSAST